MKLTKAEKRAKLKKMRKEEKKHGKEVPKAEVEETPQAAVLVLSNLFNNIILTTLYGLMDPFISKFEILYRFFIKMIHKRKKAKKIF